MTSSWVQSLSLQKEGARGGGEKEPGKLLSKANTGKVPCRAWACKFCLLQQDCIGRKDREVCREVEADKQTNKQTITQTFGSDSGSEFFLS